VCTDTDATSPLSKRTMRSEDVDSIRQSDVGMA
jgi:hypothetical protein